MTTVTKTPGYTAPFAAPWTEPPTHVVGETVRTMPAVIECGREPLDEADYLRLSDDDRLRTPVRKRLPLRKRLSNDEVRAMRPAGVEDLALVGDRSPGDLIAMSAVLRELHRTYPGKYRTAVSSRFPELWENNPHVTPAADVVQPRRIDWDWRNGTPGDNHRHYAQIWRDDLQRQLGVPIPMASVRGDVHLSAAEMEWPADLLGPGPRPFAIINAGVKADMPAKAWGAEKYQAVVDHFAGKIEFVQIGMSTEHDHRPLAGATNLLDQTGIRDLMRLVHWAEMVVCPITFVMHLSAAMPKRDGSIRPCIVMAGGREPVEMIDYPGHTVIDTIGQLPCCASGPCGRQLLPPKKSVDMSCLLPVLHEGTNWRASCMERIPVDQVTRAIECVYGATRRPVVSPLIARPYTLLDDSRLVALACSAEEATELPGDVAELGVYRGGTARLLRAALPAKHLHLFDTFEGMPPADASIDYHRAGEFGDTSLAGVSAAVGDVSRVSFHAGIFPTTAAGLEDARFCLVHLDADLYSSTIEGLRFFWPRLVPGGLIVLDDYRWVHCEGVEKAVKEFFADKVDAEFREPAIHQLIVKKLA